MAGKRWKKAAAGLFAAAAAAMLAACGANQAAAPSQAAQTETTAETAGVPEYEKESFAEAGRKSETTAEAVEETDSQETETPEASATAGETQKALAETGESSGGQALVLKSVKQWGNYYQFRLVREITATGELVPFLGTDGGGEVTLTVYEDPEGQKLLGRGLPKEGYGCEWDGPADVWINVNWWNEELAGSVRITLKDGEQELNYLFPTRNVEVQKTCTREQAVKDENGVIGYLVKAEEYPNALYLEYRLTESEQKKWREMESGISDIALKGKNNRGQIGHEEFIRGRDDVVGAYYTFQDSEHPMEEIESLLVPHGTDEDTWIANPVDFS